MKAEKVLKTKVANKIIEVICPNCEYTNKFNGDKYDLSSILVCKKCKHILGFRGYF